MKTLLLISSEENSGSLEELHALPGLRTIPRRSAAESASAVGAGVFDLALVVAREWTPLLANEIHQLRAVAPRLPLLVATSPDQLMSAYAAGADAAVPWPEPNGLLPSLVQRWISSSVLVSTPVPAAFTSSPSAAPWPATPASSHSALEILRDFSKVLSHALDEQSLAQRLVEQLAEILGVVRIALFFEPEPQVQPVAPLTGSDPRLACAAAIGIPAEVTSCLELSRDGGLGRLMTTRRGVFSKYSPHVQTELQGDFRILQEFEVLGCDMAISIRDRDKTIGVAVLGERITGQPFTTEELNLGYFLMGELGMAIRNSRLHRMVTLNHELLSSVLESITSGSLVIGPDLRVLHANRAATTLLGVPSTRPAAVSDLPTPVLQALHAVVTREANADPIFHDRGAGGTLLLRYSIVPLRSGGPAAPSRPVIVLIEDWTKIHAAKQAEIESANTRLITTIAARFAHEIRNSLVPLSTHAQLFEAEVGNANFLESLRTSLHRETLRIRRLSDQMLFLAAPGVAGEDTAPVGDLLNEAVVAAQEIAGRSGQLVCTGDRELRIRCARIGLVYALQEILANSLQSVASGATIRVKVQPTRLEGKPAVQIAFSDSGAGFTAETAAHATEPFYTTRTTGVGLGLAVARKIIAEHGGRLAIHDRSRTEEPDIILTLPAS